jgi:hypothetical protein
MFARLIGLAPDLPTCSSEQTPFLSSAGTGSQSLATFLAVQSEHALTKPNNLTDCRRVLIFQRLAIAPGFIRFFFIRLNGRTRCYGRRRAFRIYNNIIFHRNSVLLTLSTIQTVRVMRDLLTDRWFSRKVVRVMLRTFTITGMVHER